MARSEKIKLASSGSRELLSGADMVIRALHDEGVDVIFGYPGGAVLHIYDALFRYNANCEHSLESSAETVRSAVEAESSHTLKPIRHILVRHEQAAVHMADGYARALGQPGVVLATSGPGATNTITGIATAYMDSIPLVVITGQVASNLIGEDAFQETDMVGVSRPIVKHSYLVRDAQDIPMIIKKAFHIATTGRPGPVVVDIPKDKTNPLETFAYEYPAQLVMRSYNPATKGHPGQIKKALALIAQAKRPIIYSGGGVVQGNAERQLTQLGRRLGCPITSTLMGLGGFPCNDEQFLGMLGMHGTYEANMAMHNSDLIFAVGVRFDDRVTNNVKLFCPSATIVHIDVDPASISKTVSAHVPIVGLVDYVLDEMCELLSGDQYRDISSSEALSRWWDQIKGWRKRGCLDYDQPKKGAILPQHVVKTVYEVTKGEAIVTSDVGQHQMFAALYYPFKYSRQWINSGGLGTMGFGLPAAMGVLCAFPDKTVVCITGEGSIQMNIQELSTCLQYGFPVKIININNQALGMVKQWQDMQYDGRHSSSTYQDSLPDFVRLAESYGHVGMKVERAEDLEKALRDCFSLKMKDRLVFMDIYVDPEVHVHPMHIKDGAMKDMWLSKTERT